MPIVPQPSAKKKKQVLSEVASYTKSPLFGAELAMSTAAPEQTGMAESFQLVTLDPKYIGKAASGTSDIGDGLRKVGRWHHQMLVGNLPSYAESLADNEENSLGTLVTNSPLATQIDSDWEKAVVGIPKDARVRLLRLPGYSLVAFVATSGGGEKGDEADTKCWIVSSDSTKPAIRGKWLSSRQFGEALVKMEPAQGFTTAKEPPSVPSLRISKVSVTKQEVVGGIGLRKPYSAAKPASRVLRAKERPRIANENELVAKEPQRKALAAKKRISPASRSPRHHPPAPGRPPKSK